MILDLIYIIMIMASGQAILLGFHFLNKKENQLPHRLLGILMFFFTLDILDVLVLITGYYKEHPHLIGITATFPYIYGPFLYLFAKSISEKLEKLTWRHYLHFLPFVLMNIWGIPNVYLRDISYKLSLVQQLNPDPAITILGMLIPVIGIIYVILSFRVFLGYRNRIKQNYSNIDQINMEWLRFFIIGNGIVWTFVIFSYILSDIIQDWRIPSIMIYIPVSSFVIWTGYISLTKKSNYLVNAAEDTSIPVSPSYSKSGLTSEQADAIILKLKTIIEREKPYKNSSLRLQDLSNLLDIPPHYLTEILNTKLKLNFYDFINGYRVNEVKKLIEEDRNRRYNLLNIGLEAGFTSKSSFNSIFKKQTGLTPSEFRNKLQNKPAA